jgi:DNA-binding response OmpR family regulator
MTGSDEAKVLIVDDNAAIADTYTAFLTDTYEVETVYDGESALEALGPSLDVVLLDRRMPDVSGDEVLEKIDQHDFDCRVVMVTAVDPEFDIIDMPFDDYVVKPVGREELNHIVDEMIDRARYDDGLRRFLALVSKKTTLEAKKESGELAASEEYRRITDRLEERRDELAIDTEDLERVIAGDVPDIEPELEGES